MRIRKELTVNKHNPTIRIPAEFVNQEKDKRRTKIRFVLRSVQNAEDVVILDPDSVLILERVSE